MGGGQPRLDERGHLRRDARAEHAVMGLPEPIKDGGCVLVGLALAEHDLRQPLAQRAVEVQLRIAQVLIGQRLQAIERSVDGQLARLHRVQQVTQLVRVHAPG